MACMWKNNVWLHVSNCGRRQVKCFREHGCCCTFERVQQVFLSCTVNSASLGLPFLSVLLPLLWQLLGTQAVPAVLETPVPWAEWEQGLDWCLVPGVWAQDEGEVQCALCSSIWTQAQSKSVHFILCFSLFVLLCHRLLWYLFNLVLERVQESCFPWNQ